MMGVVDLEKDKVNDNPKDTLAQTGSVQRNMVDVNLIIGEIKRSLPMNLNKSGDCMKKTHTGTPINMPSAKIVTVRRIGSAAIVMDRSNLETERKRCCLGMDVGGRMRSQRMNSCPVSPQSEIHNPHDKLE